jgi:hypothetical protein
VHQNWYRISLTYFTFQLSHDESLYLVHIPQFLTRCSWLLKTNLLNGG